MTGFNDVGQTVHVIYKASIRTLYGLYRPKERHFPRLGTSIAPCYPKRSQNVLDIMIQGSSGINKTVFGQVVQHKASLFDFKVHYGLPFWVIWTALTLDLVLLALGLPE